MIPIFAWQDGVHSCEDGAKYTSGTRQPSPFNRRFCSWPPRVLACVTWASFCIMAALFGTVSQALLFLTLPGVWFCTIHPTTVDGPAMLCAWGASLLWPAHPIAAVAVALLGGFIHERAPVFAALYAWHPVLLAGLVAPALLGLLRKPGGVDRNSTDLADALVGHSAWGAVLAHRPHVDLLNDTGLVWSLRGLPVIAAWAGVGPRAWVTLAVAYLSRLVATDTVRCLLWAAPPLCVHAPAWMVALHVMTFRRVSR